MDITDDEPSLKKARYATEEQVPENSKNKGKMKPVSKFRLRGPGETASLSIAAKERVPLMLTEVQQLLLHALLGNSIIYQPSRWYYIEKSNHVKGITCLVIEGVSIHHWMNYKTTFAHANKIFPNLVEIVTPSIYGGSLIQELAVVPITDIEKESLIRKYGSMNAALESRKDLMIMMKALFPIKNGSEEDSEYVDKKFSRMQLVLSAQQLIEENYPIPLKGKYENIFSEYVMTKDIYKPLTPDSPMFAMDCEMCITEVGSELTRISIVNEKHETIYETFVKPYNDIVNYLTQYSGVNKSILQDVTKRLEDVQKDLKELLPADAILIGQSLNVDMQALRMMHPYVIDTSSIFNFVGERGRKPKLKTLAREFLNECIQEDKNGHCSIEDALACMKLVQLKLNKSIDFGDAVLGSKNVYKNNVTSENKCKDKGEYASTIFKHLIEQKKKSVIVCCDDITGDYHPYLTKANDSFMAHSLLKKKKPIRIKLTTVEQQDDVITTMANNVTDYDFVMGHLKIDINSEDKAVEQIQTVDNWIYQIYNSISVSTICVVIFAGTTSDNGIAMINIKNNSRY